MRKWRREAERNVRRLTAEMSFAKRGAGTQEGGNEPVAGPPPRSWSACPRCEQRMAPGVSCCECAWPGGVPAIRFGSETWISLPNREFCPDCNAPRGGTHHYDCDTEQCPHAWQAWTCDKCEPVDDLGFDPTPRLD